MSKSNPKVITTFSCSSDLFKRLREYAAEQDRSMSSVIRQALESWLKRKKA